MTEPEAAGALARMPTIRQWVALVVLSALLVAGLEFLHMPAALLIGPMAAGVVLGINGATVRVARPAFLLSQGVIGCLIAASLRPEMLAPLLAGWPVYLAVVLVTLAASGLLGAAVSRWGSLPGTTAVWGSAPGAASAMVLMADAFGADARLVAFMQYLRVIIVSVSAALFARLWVDLSGAQTAPVVWFPALAWPDFPATLAVAVAGVVLGGASRVPGGTLLGPLALGAALHLGAGIDFQLPEWLLAASYAVIGWAIGLRFTRATLMHAGRALPQIVASILALIAFCGLLAAMLSWLLGVEPLTAFLATSPGGMDSVAIIAAASREVDMAFVMTLQLVRFLVVLVLGPPLARFIATRMKT